MDKINWKQIAATAAVAILVSLGVIQTRPVDTKTIVQEVPRAGSVASPDIISPYFSYGGVRFWAGSASFSQNSKTACAIQSPAGTSTLESVAVNVTNGTGTTFPIEVGWGTTSGATTTLILSSTVPASKSLSMIATSTGLEQAFGGAGINEKNTVQPSTWINFNLGTTSYPAVSGVCKATFMELN